MELQPYQIPKSYQSYLETFDEDPEAAINRLKNRVEKRNAGAVGYFFLAWLYLKNGDKEKALEASIQAKIMAPGSRLMSRLHYYISHPHSFKAWEPTKNRKAFKRDLHSLDHSHPIQDLDGLIAKLSSVQSKRIKPDMKTEEDKRDLSERSSDVDDIVTETLAVIHEKQKNYPAAISTYERLKNVNESKSDYFDEQISRLKTKLEEETAEE
jgi:tetratricopeptide (TPR) repeat protein